MRQGKTQQLCALENLRATYACCGNGSILCNKYCKISLSFELTKICGRAESMIEKLREHFVFDIDQGRRLRSVEQARDVDDERDGGELSEDLVPWHDNESGGV